MAGGYGELHRLIIFITEGKLRPHYWGADSNKAPQRLKASRIERT
jgi:hypothetical protein